MKPTQLWILAAFQLIFCGGLLAQDVDMEPVPAAQAQGLLKALIPPKKKFVVINAYVAGSHVKDVNLGVSCSSSSSGSTTGSVDDGGNISAQTRTDGSSSCREIHHYYHTLLLGFADSSEPKSAYLLTVQCVRKWVWDHCDMPPDKSLYPVVLEAEKHGSFNVYAATSEKLGGKQKVAKFAVIDLSHVRQNDGNQAAALEDKKN